MREEIFRKYAEQLAQVIARERMSKETLKSYRSALRGYAEFLCSGNFEGQTSIKTTEVYLHCLPLVSSRSVSPLDAAISGPPEKIIPFSAPQAPAIQIASI